MSYRICTSCGASDGQGCYSTCPTMLQARVAELEAELSNYACTCEKGYCAMQDGYRDHCGSTASALLNRTAQENTND